MLYIFVDKKGKRLAFREEEAHQQLRNKNTWQRQDLTYIGACNITSMEISSMNASRRERAKIALVQADESIVELKLRQDVAILKKDEQAIKLCEAEIALLTSEISNRLKVLDNMTEVIDKTHQQYTKILNKLEEEDLGALEVDKTKLPRDFNTISRRLSGKEITE